MVAARFFDGQHSAARAVTLSIHGGRVSVQGDGLDRDVPIEAVEISERIGRTPRSIRFPDGTFCEVTDVDALDAILTSARVSSGALSQWETSGRLVAVLAVVLLAIGALAYSYGLPWAAGVIAHRVPVSALDGLSNQVLASLDRHLLAQTEVPESRRIRLAARLTAVRWPGGISLPMRLEFRKSDALGANALALPSGLIVVTDRLVALSAHDDEVLAVLAHEAGHVQARHGLRSIVQSSFVSVLVTWFVGDVGSLIAVAPTVLLEAKYSRDLEREADDFAAALLSANGLSPGLLADILERMDEERGAGNDGLTGGAYLSSHPSTAERRARLRGR